MSHVTATCESVNVCVTASAHRGNRNSQTPEGPEILKHQYLIPRHMNPKTGSAPQNLKKRRDNAKTGRDNAEKGRHIADRTLPPHHHININYTHLRV